MVDAKAQKKAKKHRKGAKANLCVLAVLGVLRTHFACLPADRRFSDY